MRFIIGSSPCKIEDIHNEERLYEIEWIYERAEVVGTRRNYKIWVIT